MKNNTLSSAPAIVVAKTSSLTREASEALTSSVLDAASQGARLVVVDLSAVRALDGVSVCALAALPRLVGRDVRVVLAGVQPEVLRTMVRSRLHGVLDTYFDGASATARARGFAARELAHRASEGASIHHIDDARVAA